MPKFGRLPAPPIVWAWRGTWRLAAPIPLLLPLPLSRTWRRTRTRALPTWWPVLPPALTAWLADSLVAAGRWAMTVIRLTARGPSRRPWPVPAITLPAGLGLLPAGLGLLPAGLGLLPAGLRLLPAGLRLLPAGLRLLPAGLRLLPADIGALVLGPVRIDAPVLGRLARSWPERAAPAGPGASGGSRVGLAGWRLVVPVLIVDRLVPDLRGLPWLHAPSAGWLSGRNYAERVQPLIGIGVADTTRRLQVMRTRVMTITLSGAHPVTDPMGVPGFALARITPILASCGHG